VAWLIPINRPKKAPKNSTCYFSATKCTSACETDIFPKSYNPTKHTVHTCSVFPNVKWSLSLSLILSVSQINRSNNHFQLHYIESSQEISNNLKLVATFTRAFRKKSGNKKENNGKWNKEKYPLSIHVLLRLFLSYGSQSFCKCSRNKSDSIKSYLEQFRLFLAQRYVQQQQQQNIHFLYAYHCTTAVLETQSTGICVHKPNFHLQKV
jgi:hypothetical protein